ncbi:hypothetical protein N0V93_009175 [Gnomoniopsis smithogilvyi]|uniref:Uncharacterized protein n=1 Tax=Gnomoniopsis smithogilvyi TaxID=1191159 RepID=A0A9W8YJI5_9PEZI|nr:hypothetical protein N0V93_009175 [Gnomoniopsis smithogilvyi]
MTFDPQRCADMHNELLRRANQHDPTAITERNLMTRFLEAGPEFADIAGLEELPIYQFLSSLDTNLALPERGPGLLTPHMLQPDPLGFWGEAFAMYERPEIILLYGQNSGEPTDGGLFFNLHTDRVVWHWAPGPFPAEEQWISLEVALQQSLDKWNSGKYFWNPEQGIVDVRLWTENDVTEALCSWDRLLRNIEERLPTDTGEFTRLQSVQLDQETRRSCHISDFAAEFLCRAPKPNFTHVAPGITTFSADSLAELYRSEEEQALRRSYPTGPGDPEGGDWATLLLPSTQAVVQDVSRHPDFEVQSFDKEWGFGKFTVNRRAGLYILAQLFDSNTVRLINPSGISNAGDFTGRCPWGEKRPSSLAEILDHWALLVESGAWGVGADGVAEAADWFDTHMAQSQLNWLRQTQQQRRK